METKKIAKATSDVKSGNENKKFATSVLGGYPPTKGVEQISKENSPKKAPGSVRS